VAVTCNGETYAVMMTTPQDLEDFAVGFSLSEGVISSSADMESLDLVRLDDGIEVRMWFSKRKEPGVGGDGAEKRRHRCSCHGVRFGPDGDGRLHGGSSRFHAPRAQIGSRARAGDSAAPQRQRLLDLAVRRTTGLFRLQRRSCDLGTSRSVMPSDQAKSPADAGLFVFLAT